MTAPGLHRIELALPVAQAFELFVRGMARWWPFKGHSCGGSGQPSAMATRLELNFEVTAAGRALNLIHDGWAARGANADDVRNGYLHGWAEVLQRWAAVAAKESW